MTLVGFKGNLNSVFYVDAHQHSLILNADGMFKNIWIFQEDNAAVNNQTSPESF